MFLHTLLPSSVPVRKVNSSQHWLEFTGKRKDNGRAQRKSCLMLYCLHEIGWGHFHCLKASSDALSEKAMAPHFSTLA